MKIIALNASGRKGGNTAQLLGLIEKRLSEKADSSGVDLEYENISLYGLNLEFCRGCRICFDKGEENCPLRDGLSDLYAKLQTADGVIFASPVYVEDVSGIMKNFIDRMAFNCHRPAFAGKTALIVSTSGMGSSGHTGRTMRYALTSWGFHIAGMGKFSMGALMNKDEAKEHFSGSVKKLADRLLTAITDKKQLKPSLFSLLVFKVQQKCYRRDAVYKDTYDHAWWEKKGYLDKTASFYIPHKASPVKTLIAKILSVPIYKMFT